MPSRPSGPHPVARPPRAHLQRRARGRARSLRRATLGTRRRRRRSGSRRAPRGARAPATRRPDGRPIVTRPYSDVARRPPGRSSEAVPPLRASAEDRVGVRARSATSPAIRWSTSRASAGGSVVEVGVERRVDGEVEHLGLVAQQRQRAQHVRLGRRVQVAGSRGSARAPTSALVASSRHGSPRSAQYAAVSARVTPSSGRTTRPERAGMPSSARRPGEATSR